MTTRYCSQKLGYEPSDHTVHPSPPPPKKKKDSEGVFV